MKHMQHLTDQATVTLRTPAELIAKIKVLAAAEDRSLNAQIVRMLRQQLEAKEKD